MRLLDLAHRPPPGAACHPARLTVSMTLRHPIGLDVVDLNRATGVDRAGSRRRATVTELSPVRRWSAKKRSDLDVLERSRSARGPTTRCSRSISSPTPLIIAVKLGARRSNTFRPLEADVSRSVRSRSLMARDVGRSMSCQSRVCPGRGSGAAYESGHALGTSPRSRPVRRAAGVLQRGGEGPEPEMSLPRTGPSLAEDRGTKLARIGDDGD